MFIRNHQSLTMGFLHIKKVIAWVVTNGMVMVVLVMEELHYRLEKQVSIENN